jgi:hypothetical protein
VAGVYGEQVIANLEGKRLAFMMSRLLPISKASAWRLLWTGYCQSRRQAPGVYDEQVIANLEGKRLAFMMNRLLPISMVSA